MTNIIRARNVRMLCNIKPNGALSGMTQFLTMESPSKMMKNAFFILKVLFVLKIFNFLS